MVPACIYACVCIAIPGGSKGKINQQQYYDILCELDNSLILNSEKPSSANGFSSQSKGKPRTY